MIDEFFIKRNDRRETLERILKGSTGAIVDISGAAVKFIMRETLTGVIKINSVATIVGAGTDGHVRYSWAAGDTDTAGLYDAEWQVTFADGTPQTFPNDGYLVVHILPDAGS